MTTPIFLSLTEGDTALGVQLDSITTALRTRKLVEPVAVAKQVSSFLRAVISALAASSTEITVGDVFRELQFVEAHLSTAVPTAFVACNVCSRVLRLVPEEAEKKRPASTAATSPSAASASASGATGGAGGVPSVAEVRTAAVSALAASRSGAGSAPSSAALSADIATLPFRAVREGVLDAVGELLDEIDSSTTTTSAYAADYLADDDVVLTAGHSDAVLSFINGAKKRGVSVLVAEGGPALPGHRMAAALCPETPSGASSAAAASKAPKPVPTTVIPDADVAAVMHRATRVIISAHAIVVEGKSWSFVCDAGAYAMLLCAQQAAKPVICVANALQVVPAAPARTAHVIAAADSAEGSVADILSIATSAKLSQHVDISAPLFDIVPGELVGTCITNAQVLASAAQALHLATDLYA